MKKNNLNLIIDALLLICTAAVVGIGFLMKYVLVPGYRRWEIYDRNVDLFLWNLDRHQWGTIHLSIGLVFLGLLVLHIILHWSMIVRIYRGLIPNSLARWTVALAIVFITALLVAFPVLIKPEVHEQGRGQGHGWSQCDAKCDIRSECPAAAEPQL